MKSAAFNDLIAQVYTTPVQTVTVYTRLLKEAGLMTTGARGRNAPEATPLDAARLTIAMLATDRPSQCVERVRRFGQIRFSPESKKTRLGVETIRADDFALTFKGETLEEVLAFLFSRVSEIGLRSSIAWFEENLFHLRIFDFDVRAELFALDYQSGQIVGELMVPFQGQIMTKSGDDFRPVEGFPVIKGGIRTERSISNSAFPEVGMGLVRDSGNVIGEE